MRGESLLKAKKPQIYVLAVAWGLITAMGLTVAESGRSTLPVRPADWLPPTEEEIAQADSPRYYPPQEDAVMTLTIDAIKLYDVPVVDSGSEQDLDKGVIHLPQTPMPWDDKEQKNVYLAGERVGRTQTNGRLLFFNLNKLKTGDSVLLKDDSGSTYEYEVSDIFTVEPDAHWVVQPLRGEDMLTLQTCTYPTGENRLIIRANRV